jgi:hypothetical protein
MINLLYGAALLAGLWWLSRLFAGANPTALARGLKVAGGVLALGGAATFGLRGRFDMAVLLGGLGAWLLGWNGLRLPGWGAPRARPAAGSVSRVRSAMLEMELDHDTGAMRGTVLAGPHSGRDLDGLSPDELRAVLDACLHGDPDGVRLLEAYLDRRSPGWREHADGDAHPRQDDRPRPGAMTEEEAYQILGLAPGSGPEEIRAAHRSLMKRLHPDGGGSTWLAARVNQAKDVLLSRHR